MKTEKKKILLPEEIFVCNGKEFSNFSNDTLRAEGIYTHTRESMAKNRARMDAQTQIAYLYQTFFSGRNPENDHVNMGDSIPVADHNRKEKKVHLTIRNMKIICSETNFEDGEYTVKVVAQVSIHDIRPPA